MLFCENCGAQLEDDAKFCEKCGTPVEPQKGNHSAPSAKTVPTGTNPAVKLNKKLIGIVAGVVIVVAAIVIFFLTRPVKVDLNDYLTISFSGYDTVGKASYDFDEDAFFEDYGEDIEYKGSESLITALMDQEDICNYLVDMYIDGSFDVSSGLTNGDEIHFEWDCNDEAIKENFGIVLSYENKTCTVEGLQEALQADPFEGVTLSFTGTAPNGKAHLEENTSVDYSYDLDFQMEPSKDLKNGDTVTVSLPFAETQEGKDFFLKNYGVVFTQTEKTYTVEGLESYVSQLSEIPAESLEKMKAQGQDALRADAAKNWSENCTLGDVSYMGCYLLTGKDLSNGFSEKNMLYIVYQVQATVSVPKDKVQETFSYYYTIRYDDLIAAPDGTITVDLGDYSTPYDSVRKSYGGFNTFYFVGYSDLDTTFAKCVTAVIDRYTYETNIEGQ